MKHKLSSTHVLALPNFDNVFEVETNASMTSIGAMLSQEGKLIEFSVKSYLKPAKSGVLKNKSCMQL